MTGRPLLARWVLAAAVIVGTLAPAGAGAQRRRAEAPRTCALIFDNRDSTRMVSLKVYEGRYNTFIGGGVFARCAASDQRITADSAEYYGDQRLLTLIGTVRYVEARIAVDADRMDYFTADERLVADGRVFARTPGGTVMRGPHAEYWRPVVGLRPWSRLAAAGRPTVKLSPADAKESRDTVDLVANTVTSENDSLVYAGGEVVITRPDLVATGDSAFVDNGREFATLMRTPVITGTGERPFALKGETIDLFSRQRAIRRVVARGKGEATSDDLVLTSDTIDLRFDAQKLQEAFAFGPGRARARSADRDIRADSIRVTMPDQVLETMYALRNAIAETKPDTAKVTSPDPDWLRGDTIVAHFEAVRAAGDSASRTRLKEVTSSGAARSFYQVAGKSGGKTGRPNVNYVAGKAIAVAFAEGQVQRVTVREQATGVYLEALPDSTAADSTAADSTATRGKRPPAAGRARSGRAPRPTPSRPARSP